MIQVQLVKMLGLNLAGTDTCPRCEEPITRSDGSFVAVRLPDREAMRFHLDCYEVFATGLATFRSEILPMALLERVH